MAMAAKRVDLIIVQGDTFERMVRWESKPYQYAAITGITQAAPAVIHAAAHGLTDGWRVAVINVLGMTQINSKYKGMQDGDFVPCTYIDADHIALNEISSAEFDAYVSGGFLKYYTAVDLNPFTTAKLEIRDRIGGTILATLDESSGITITPLTQTIQLEIARDVTAAFTWKKGVYDLQMIDTGDKETTILTGTITVKDEATK
jgi:hypothetical protein